MLGYGWASLNAKDYSAALTPWRNLHNRSMLESTTHEALLALPFIYEKLGARADALAYYDIALSRMQQQMKVLEQLNGEINPNAIALVLAEYAKTNDCLLYTSPSPRDAQ